MKEHFINDSGYYPYGEYNYVKVSKEYIEQENYDKSFFEVLDYLKDDKEKVKEFLKDLVFVEMIDDNNLLHKDNYFISKELFEKEYNKIFNNNSDILAYKINTLTLTDKDNKQNEIELEKNDKANIIIANIIGREKFADLYFQIKKDSFEKEIDKVKTKEKEIEL